MYADEDLLPLSALQHLVFCERQAALIHVEREWADNALTLEGHHLHRVVDGDGRPSETRGNRRVVRGVLLRSYVHGLVGKADVIELMRDDAGGVTLHGLSGAWRVMPVEYKRGKPKRDRCDEVQLCAQALCLEEMLGCPVSVGVLYYGSTRHREEVPLTSELRAETLARVTRFREIVERRLTPHAAYEPKCRRCSLLEKCMPQLYERRAASLYLAQSLWKP